MTVISSNQSVQIRELQTGKAKLPERSAIVFILLGDSYASGIAPSSTFASVYELPDGTPTTAPGTDLATALEAKGAAFIGNKWTQANPNAHSSGAGVEADDWVALDHTMGADVSGTGTQIGPEWGIAYSLLERYAGTQVNGGTPEVYCIKQAITSAVMDVSQAGALINFHPAFNSGVVPAGGGAGQFDCLVEDQIVPLVNGLLDGSIVGSGSSPRRVYFEGVYACGPNGDASGAANDNAEMAWPGNFQTLLDALRLRLTVPILNTVLSVSPLIGTAQTKDDGTYNVPAGTELLRERQLSWLKSSTTIGEAAITNRSRVQAFDPSNLPRGTDRTHPTGQGSLWLGLSMGRAMDSGRAALYPITADLS